jgi:hypothetical protein
VIPCAGSADTVLLDTSVIVNFADAGMLIQLAEYLGPKAAITLDVHRELTRLAGSSHPELATLERLKWPRGEALALPPDLLADADALRKLHSRPGEHESAHLGEISTALIAPRLPNAIVVMEDGFGKRLCRNRGTPRLSSAQLAAEMVAVAELDEESGYAVFGVATPIGIGRAEFVEALGKARAALS